jgi:hypothetical protein
MNAKRRGRNSFCVFPDRPSKTPTDVDDIQSFIASGLLSSVINVLGARWYDRADVLAELEF